MNVNPPMKRMLLLLLAIGIAQLSLLCPSTHAKTPDMQKAFKNYHRPLFAYIGVEGDGYQKLSPKNQKKAEQQLLKALQLKRFQYLKIPFSSKNLHIFIKKMIKVILKRSKGMARMKAEWDAQFQGFKVTSRLLEAIRSQSYIYWIDIDKYIKSQRTETETYKDKDGKDKEREKAFCVSTLQAKLHIHRLEIFDCSEANRKKSPQHQRLCQGKRDQDFAGFAKPHHILVQESKKEKWREPEDGKLPALDECHQSTFDDALDSLKRDLKIKLKDKFKLFSTISYTTTNHVYFPLGKVENVKLNQGFNVYIQHVKGHLIHKGYVKLRSVGDNRLRFKGNRKFRVNPKEPFFSSAEIISSSGNFRMFKGMFLQEHQQHGFFFALHGGGIGVIEHKPTLSSQGNSNDWTLSPTIKLDFGGDLSNLIGFSEWYLQLAMEFGLFFQDLSAFRKNPQDSPGDIGGIVFVYIGIIKKFHFRRFVLSLGFQAGGAFMREVFPEQTDLKTQKPITKESETHASGGIEGLVGLEYFFTPAVQFALRGGYRLHSDFGGFSASVSGPWFSAGFVFTL